MASGWNTTWNPTAKEVKALIASHREYGHHDEEDAPEQPSEPQGRVLPCGYHGCGHAIQHHDGKRCQHVGCPPHRYEWPVGIEDKVEAVQE